MHAESNPRGGGRRAAVLAGIGQFLVVFAVLGLGLLGSRHLVTQADDPPHVEPPEFAPLVVAERIQPADMALSVEGYGTLDAQTRVTLAPQIAARVVAIDPVLRAGGRFRAGQVLVELERIDQELNLAQARSAVAAAQTVLERERAEAGSATLEWQALQPDEPVPPLLAREPQIAEGEARLASARASVEQAQLALDRSRLSLPFDGCVVRSMVEAGDLVSIGKPLAEVYAVAVFEVPVPLADHELALLEIPGLTTSEPLGSPAVVRTMLAGVPRTYGGRVARLEGEIDPVSRLARVVVELRPGVPEATPDAAPTPVPGAFADVTFEGRVLENVALVRRAYMRDDGVVWTVVDGHMRFVRPEVVHESDAALYVRGLQPNTLLVTSDLDVATDGMAVRLSEEVR